MYDLEKIKKNCKEFGKNQKRINLIKFSNGKRSNEELSKMTSYNYTTASKLLNDARRQNLVEKNSSGFFKKLVPDRYFPKISDNTSKISKRKIAKRIKKDVKIPIQNSLIPISIYNSITPMSKAYMWLYITENALRELIRVVFKKTSKTWEKDVPNGVIDSVKNIKAKTPYDAVKRKDELEYSHLGHLKEIIINKKNWNDFIPYLNERDKDKFRVIVDKSVGVRNAIGHCIKLSDQDLKIVEVRFDDILKMLEKDITLK